jgi:hypothetical protein
MYNVHDLFSRYIYIIITTVNSFYNAQWMPYITWNVQTFIDKLFIIN